MTQSSGDLEHLLNGTVKEVALQDSETRRQFIRHQRWIGYPTAQTIGEKLRLLVSHPPASRMPFMMVVGPTNNGKTMILERFQKDFPIDLALDEDAAKAPVITVVMPPNPDLRHLFCAILDYLQANFSAKDSLTYLRRLTYSHLAVLGTRVLVIDELHNLLSGRINKQREFLNELRAMAQTLRFSIVCAGTREAMNAVTLDPQLENRFSYETLPRWSDNLTLRRFLLTLQGMIPLREKSNLESDEFVRALVGVSEGLLGEIVSVVLRCSDVALRAGREAISPSDLELIRALPPSRRRAVAEREIPI